MTNPHTTTFGNTAPYLVPMSLLAYLRSWPAARGAGGEQVMSA